MLKAFKPPGAAATDQAREQRSTTWRTVAIPSAVVVAAACVLSMASGVTAQEVLRYGLYEALFVAAPGILAFRLLFPGAGPLRTLAFGWSLGVLLAVAAFAVSATAGARQAFFAYPVAALVVTGAAHAWRARRGVGRDPSGRDRTRDDTRFGAVAWTLALVCVVGMVLLTFLRFAADPLPRDITRPVLYDPDLVYYAALASEAKHHWPPQNPSVVDTPLSDQNFILSQIDVAAASYVSGDDIPVVMFRLIRLRLLVLVVLAAAAAAMTLSRLPWSGPIAAALAVGVGEIDLVAGTKFAFEYPLNLTGEEQIDLLFGAVFFLLALTALFGQISGRGRQAGWRGWALSVVLIAGCLAKAGAVPVLAGGAVLYAVVDLVRRHRMAGRPIAVAALCCGIALVLYAVLPKGIVDTTLRFFPSFDGTNLFEDAADWLPSVPRDVLAPLITMGAIAGILTPFAMGLPSAMRSAGRWKVEDRHVWICALVVAGALPLCLVSLDAAQDQRDLLWFGALAAAVGSGEGVAKVFGRPEVVRSRTLVLAWGAWCLAVFIGVAVILANIDSELAGLLVSTGAVVTMAATAAALARYLADHRAAIGLGAALVLTTIICAAALDRPIDALAQKGAKEPSREKPGLTPALAEGYGWLRGVSDPSAAVASAPRVRVAQQDAYHFYVAALAERRTLRDGWAYTRRAFDLSGSTDKPVDPYPYRRRLSDRTFSGDAAAMREMSARYGVRYLVIEKDYASRAAHAPAGAHRVYSNAEIEIYRVPPE